ncbi:hypothetical protein [Endozoicomonas sp. SESOKO1]|uniref:hypothetical protein n=1 Tax=Endozoicomonas sp. SESOKO1 TaxID=2828742 RepID=UPI00214861E7|nr:hypothetical protein [Endozoicomonas sp. SESOKO1]
MPTTSLPGCPGEPIPVLDRATLGKIGKEPCFPRNGTYTQMADKINAANLPPIRHFTGDYYGNNKTIELSNNCLFEEVEGNGRVRQLVVTGAGIRSVRWRAPRAAIACQMSGSSTLEGNRVEYSKIHVTTQDQTPLGMLTGVMNGDATLRDNQVIHSTINVHRYALRGESYKSIAGMLTGIARGNSRIDNNRVEKCEITATARDFGLDPNPRIALVAGLIDRSNVKVRNSTLIDNKMTLTTKTGLGGGVAGVAYNCLIEGTQAIGNNFRIRRGANSRNRGTHSAVVVGYAHGCTIRDTRATDNHLKADQTSYHGSRLGIVTAECVNSEIQNTLAVNSTIVTDGAKGYAPKHLSFEERGRSAGHAGVAAGYANGCEIEGTKAVEVTVKNRDTFGGAAIAAAYNRDGTEVSRTTAIKCDIAAEGNWGDGREGYGAVGIAMDHYDNFNFGIITNTSACETTIQGKYTGIAAGKSWHNDQVDGVFACNTRLTNFGQPTRIDNTGCADSDCPGANPGTESPPTSPTTAAVSRHELKSSLLDSSPSAMPAVSSQPVSSVIQPSSSPSLETSGAFGSVTSSSPETTHTTRIDDASTRHMHSTELSRETSHTLPATTTSSAITMPTSAVNGTNNGNVSARYNSNNEEVDVGMPMAMPWGIAAGVVAVGATALAAYDWYKAYKEGVRGKELVIHPFKQIKEAFCCDSTATDNRVNRMELITFKDVDTNVEWVDQD